MFWLGYKQLLISLVNNVFTYFRLILTGLNSLSFNFVLLRSVQDIPNVMKIVLLDTAPVD